MSGAGDLCCVTRLVVSAGDPGESVERSLLTVKVDFWAGLQFLFLLMCHLGVRNHPANPSVRDLAEIQEKQENTCSVSTIAVEHRVGAVLVHQLQLREQTPLFCTRCVSLLMHLHESRAMFFN